MLSKTEDFPELYKHTPEKSNTRHTHSDTHTFTYIIIHTEAHEKHMHAHYFVYKTDIEEEKTWPPTTTTEGRASHRVGKAESPP